MRPNIVKPQPLARAHNTKMTDDTIASKIAVILIFWWKENLYRNDGENLMKN